MKILAITGIGGEGAYAATQLLGHYRHGSCRRTDETNKGSFEDDLRLIILTKKTDGNHHQQCQGGADELQHEMPCLRLHLLNLYLAEGNIQQGKKHHRHEFNKAWTHRVTQWLQERNIGKNQIPQGTQDEGTGQSKLPEKRKHLHHTDMF